MRPDIRPYIRSIAILMLLASPAWAGDVPAPSPAVAGLLALPEDREVRVQLTPEKEARLTSRMNGVIDRLPLRDGDTVKQGDLIAHIQCDEREQAAAQAKARLDKQSGLARSAKKLADLGSGSKVDMQVRQAEEAEARASYELARTEAGYCDIRAPFDGRLAALAVKNFQAVRENDPVAEVLQDENLEAEMIVPSRWLAWLEKDKAFNIRVDETGREYPAVITHLGGRVDPVSQSVKVYARISDRGPELLAGMGGVALLSPPVVAPQKTQQP